MSIPRVRVSSLSTFSCIVGALLLAGCAVGPDFSSPPAPTVARYTESALPAQTVATETAGGQAQVFQEVSTLWARWWMLFDNVQLNQWVEQALADNPTLLQAEARLREAQERYNAQAGSSRYPSIDAGASVARQQINFEAMGITTIPSPPPFTLYNASVMVSYTFDWFGANTRALESLQAAADVEHYRLQAARQSLAANVVTAAVRTASVQAEIEALTAMITAQRAQLTLVEARQAMGGVAALDVQSVKSALAETEARLPALQRRYDNLRHQLAVYLGTTPGEAVLPKLPLSSLHLPATIPVTLPSEWVRQRPDISAAEALLHQASANVGVATANLYPRLTLSGSFGADALKGEKLFDNGFNVWSLGAGITQPLFRGGALRAQKRVAEAAFDAAAAGYRQTILLGFQNVADALRALDTDAQALQVRHTAVREAAVTYQLLQARYALGGVDQSTVLDAERRYQQTLLDEIQARADRYADTAALFQAMGLARPSASAFYRQ